MEAESRRKVEEMVLEILKKSNMEEATEFSIRVAASERLGIDLSNSTAKQLVRNVVESYLLSVAANVNTKKMEGIPANDDVQMKQAVVHAAKEDANVASPMRVDPERVICKLSSRRNVSVKPYKGTTLVSIKEFYMKDGKLLPGFKGISLSSEQWSTFKKNVPAIEEAITKMEGWIRSEHNGKQNGDASNAVVDVATVEPVSTTEVIHFEVPVAVTRFDGKNYQFWAQQMELFLKQLKIDYVLTEPCPNPQVGEGASAEKIAAAKAAERRWFNDDLMCHRNILNHLSDHLFNLHANRKMSARELWEELKLVYLYEEFGTKRSQVKKYIEFHMVDEKAVMEQILELNGIANSIAADGMFIDDNFHVSVIISKLPPSWKDFCIKLMREEYLPFRKLMERIQIEEEYRSGVKRVGERYNSVGFHLNNRDGQRRIDNRPLGMHRNRSEFNSKSVPCSVCGKKGHLSKNCWRRHDTQANERKAEEDVQIPTKVDTLGATQ
ncbi:hypothetical protein Fmac_007194 [Flemingia macrophylla]|uniref:CCHC-type domain-containing protein n=1 Tax=Flemingia macrophylla TaxID=520843 RepID=A0ABD1NCR3_9FABA